MPAEDINLEYEQSHDDWQQLAQEAAEDWPLEHPGVNALYARHVVPQLHTRGLGHLVIDKEAKAAGRFLHEHHKGPEPLHTSGPVTLAVEREARQADAKPPQKPAEKLAVYLQSMSERHSLIASTPDDPEAAKKLAERRERQIHRRTVDPLVAAREHLKTEARIMYEQGQASNLQSLGISVTRNDKGKLQFDIPELLLQRPDVMQKGEEKQKIQADILSKWVDYLNGKDTNYPDWFKYYCLDGVTKLGAFDKQTGRFSRRDADTLVPVPRLGRGALARVHSWLEDGRLHKLDLPEEFEDEDKQKALQAAVSGGNFGQLYVLALELSGEGTISDEQRMITEGKWKKYNQGSDPADLYGDLQGFGLDWCTSTDLYTAEHQIDTGDFFVYYTKDELGETRIPRIAIRMYDGEVAEVRGIEPEQELEPVLADIVSEQLQDLPGGESYVQRAADMKRVTALDNLLAAQPDAELTLDDLTFIYEMERTIISFGYDEDPRVHALQLKLASKHTIETLEPEYPYHLRTEQLRNYVRMVTLNQLMEDGMYEPSDDELKFIFTFVNDDQVGWGILDSAVSTEMRHIATTAYATEDILARLELIGTDEAIIRRMRNTVRLQKLGERLQRDSNCELSDADLRYIYRMEGARDTFNDSTEDVRFAILRRLRGEQDYDSLKRIIVEQLQSETRTAYETYAGITQKLGVEKLSGDDFQRLLADKEASWREQSVYELMVEDLVQYGVSYHMLAMPDGKIGPEQLYDLIEDFRTERGLDILGTYSLDEDEDLDEAAMSELVRSNLQNYSPRQLSGALGTGGMRIILVQSAITAVERRYGKTRISGTVYKQSGGTEKFIRQMYPDHTNVRLRLPTMLEAVTNWYTIAARGERLDFHGTYTNHYDLLSKDKEDVVASVVHENDPDAKDDINDGYAGDVTVAYGFEELFNQTRLVID